MGAFLSRDLPSELAPLEVRQIAQLRAVCTENAILIDYVTELPNVAMIALLCFFLTLFASPFKSKSWLEAENTLHHLIIAVT